MSSNSKNVVLANIKTEPLPESPPPPLVLPKPLWNLAKGDNVWVTQGKTDHMATFVGDPRMVCIYPDSDDDHNTSPGEPMQKKQRTDRGTQQLEVRIRWATTGNKGYVQASSVRPVVSGERRRRQLVSHYDAAPSKRPVYTRKSRGKTGGTTGSTSTSTSTGNNRSKNRNSSNVSSASEAFQPADVVSDASNPKSSIGNPVDEQLSDNGNEHSTPPTSGKRAASSPMFKMPSREEFREIMLERERKKKEKQLKLRQRRIQQLARKNGAASSNNPICGIGTEDDATERGTASYRTTIDEGYQWEWEVGSSPSSKAASAPVPYRNKKSENYLKPVPSNFGKKLPRSWKEAYHFLRDYRYIEETCEVPSNHPILGKFVCDLRSEYERFRAHTRKQLRRQKTEQQRLQHRWSPNQNHGNGQEGSLSNVKAYRTPTPASPQKDMTRVDRSRIKDLNRLGFDWRIEERDCQNETEQPSLPMLDTFKPGHQSHSPSTEKVDPTVANGKSSGDKYSKKIKRKHENKSNINDDSETRTESEYEQTDHGNGDSSVDDKRATFADEKMLDDEVTQAKETPKLPKNRLSHAGDDAVLIASVMEAQATLNETPLFHDIILSKHAAFPTHLYRLLRLATVRQDLGLESIISWTEDGGGIFFRDDNRLLEDVVSKASRMKKIVSFWNTMNRYGFLCSQRGLNGNGSQYRVYYHHSHMQAEDANDSSLRLFYRGAPAELIGSIKQKGEGTVNKKKNQLTAKSPQEVGAVKKPSKQKQLTKSHKRKHPSWMDEEYGAALPKKGNTQPGRSTSSLSSVSSSENGRIVHASKKNLQHDSSSTWRAHDRLNKKKRGRNSQNLQGERHQSRQQVRTTSSCPPRITPYEINKSNWGKIERLINLNRCKRLGDVRGTMNETSQSPTSENDVEFV